MGVTVKIEGLADVQNVLADVKDNAFRKKTLQSSYRKAGREFVKAARAKVPQADQTVRRYSRSNSGRSPKGEGRVLAEYLPGNLKKSIGTWTYRREKNPHLYLGARYGRRSMKYDGWYYRFIEFGTVHQRPQPFLRPGWEQSKPKIESRLATDFEQAFDKFKKKYKL